MFVFLCRTVDKKRHVSEKIDTCVVRKIGRWADGHMERIDRYCCPEPANPIWMCDHEGDKWHACAQVARWTACRRNVTVAVMG